MNLNLNKKTIEELTKLINIKTEYRTGPKLIEFFKILGFNDSYGPGFPSRDNYTISKLKEINGSSGIIDCIKFLFNPINFVNEDEKHEKLIKEFNNYLKFDKIKIIKERKNINVIEIDEAEEYEEVIENVTADDVKRIWGEGLNLKVFLSHKAEFKLEASILKNNLSFYGVSCFVAHEDIKPTMEWQNEIEKALFSADVLLALLTTDFHNSEWTDQEVGIAFGRNIPVISLMLGTEPYGFIGKFQGLKINIEKEYEKIIEILIKNKRMVNAYIERVKHSNSYDDSNKLAKILKCIEKLEDDQVEKLIKIYKDNDQVSKSIGFNGYKPDMFGYGLKFELKRITGNDVDL